MHPDDMPPEPDKMCEAMCSGRQSAVYVLRQTARRLRDKAHGIDKLADEFEHRSLSPDAEAALWEMVIHARQ